MVERLIVHPNDNLDLEFLTEAEVQVLLEEQRRQQQIIREWRKKRAA